MDGILSNNARDVIAVIGLALAVAGFIDIVVKYKRGRTHPLNPIRSTTFGVPTSKSKIQGERPSWQRSLAVWLGLIFFTISMFAIADWKRFGQGAFFLPFLLTFCSLYFKLLLEVTKKPFRTCIRKAYFNLVTFVIALFYVMTLLGYFNQK